MSNGFTGSGGAVEGAKIRSFVVFLDKCKQLIAAINSSRTATANKLLDILLH